MERYSLRILTTLLCTLLLAGCATAQRLPVSTSYVQRPEAQAFAADVAERHGFERSWVEAQMLLARRQERVRRLMMPAPAGATKDWAAYRQRFIEPRRIAAGVQFWNDNAAWLQLAQARYGVPAKIIVGIVGVETFYGRITGNFRVLDALATLAFDFPEGRSDRSPFFRDELEAFLVMCRREDLQPDTVLGSYAGAIGWPQFMPSSINRYAVDFDGDGRIDLSSDGADVVGSVANYLAEHGWVTGMVPYYGVRAPVDTRQRATLLVPDIVPSFTAAQFAENGAELDAAGRSHDGPLALVELQNGEAAPSYVAGTPNFYVITRYNASSYYAMAVIALGEAVQQQR